MLHKSLGGVDVSCVVWIVGREDYCTSAVVQVTCSPLWSWRMPCYCLVDILSGCLSAKGFTGSTSCRNIPQTISWTSPRRQWTNTSGTLWWTIQNTARYRIYLYITLPRVVVVTPTHHNTKTRRTFKPASKSTFVIQKGNKSEVKAIYDNSTLSSMTRWNCQTYIPHAKLPDNQQRTLTSRPST